MRQKDATSKNATSDAQTAIGCAPVPDLVVFGVDLLEVCASVGLLHGLQFQLTEDGPGPPNCDVSYPVRT